ncbi:nucleotidyltransferase domain-containing protein [Nisaea nitritireducens]|uniref:nucleotidyltransferase domain-containing protein n=1 Tax=Nisaea nitritireducens TaxID=568392 RepID=UPI0018681223|nr:hypothetical protein [Nisaea nitritireducens]
MQSDAFHVTLGALAAALDGTADPWWIFGGAALALHGVVSEDPRDIDVLVSEADAARLAHALDIGNGADGGTAKFRSSWFLKPALGPVPVEVMAGFEIFSAGAWHPVRPRSRERKTIGEIALFVPSQAEIAEILSLSGRPKDLARLELL